MTSKSLPAKALSGLYVLLAISLVSSLSFLLDSVAYYRLNGLELSGSTGYIARFEALRKDLPPTGRVSYWTNTANDPGDLEFHLTQFALAPLLLEKNLKNPYVVGNIAGDPAPEELTARGLQIVKNYGLGVVLYRKVAQ